MDRAFHCEIQTLEKNVFLIAEWCKKDSFTFNSKAKTSLGLIH